MSTDSEIRIQVGLTTNEPVFITKKLYEQWAIHNGLEYLPVMAKIKTLLHLIRSTPVGSCYIYSDKDGGYALVPIPGDLEGKSTAYVLIRETTKKGFNFSAVTIMGAAPVVKRQLAPEGFTAPINWSRSLPRFRAAAKENNHPDYEHILYTFEHDKSTFKLDLLKSVTDDMREYFDINTLKILT